MEISIDIESYSELDLRKVGLYKYAAHPSTEILMVAYRFGKGPMQIWDMYDGDRPRDLITALQDPTIIKKAFNAQFERVMFRDVWGIDVPAQQWRCIMVWAWYMAFSGGLGEVGRQMGLPQDQLKTKEGRRLIQKFSKPQPKNHKIRRHTRDTAPEDWASFREYCTQDVVAEDAIEDQLVLHPVPDHIWEEWVIDQEINDRGVPVDLELIDAAVELDAWAKAELKDRMNAITGLANSNSRDQLMPWAEAHGVELKNLQKDYIERTVEKLDPGPVRDVLDMRLQVSQTASAKWAAFQTAAQEDGRVRGMFSFGGAQRTLRWSGRIVQLHNMRRGSKDAPKLAEAILQKFPVVHFCERPVDLLADAIRTAITAPEGKQLGVCDLGSIESRVLGCLSGCEAINSIFREGRDTYRAFGKEYFHKAEYDITSEERTFCKPAVLGCGYQLGRDGLIDYAEGYGVTLGGKEAQRLVDLFRAIYPEVPRMWEWLVNAVKQTTLTGETMVGYGVSIWMDRTFLRIRLPSGRDLSYFRPQIRQVETPWSIKARREAAEEGRDLPARIFRPAFTYMGRNQYTNQWTRISTHGGKITENIVQAVARDVLMYHIRLMQGWSVVGHVHDEVIFETPDDVWYRPADGSVRDAEVLMCSTPPWIPGLLLGAEGFITKRYMKG